MNEWGGIVLLVLLGLAGLPMLAGEWIHQQSKRAMKRSKIEVDHKEIR